MKKAIFTWASFCLSLATAPVNAQTGTHNLAFRDINDFQSYFHYTAGHRPIISGHRGGTTTGYPENCIATFENTLRHTPTFFEIDPRLTKDSVIVVMHDASLDRTTTGKGKVSDYTYAQLQQYLSRICLSR